jgi:hypothetical protein
MKATIALSAPSFSSASGFSRKTYSDEVAANARLHAAANPRFAPFSTIRTRPP